MPQLNGRSFCSDCHRAPPAVPRTANRSLLEEPIALGIPPHYAPLNSLFFSHPLSCYARLCGMVSATKKSTCNLKEALKLHAPDQPAQAVRRLRAFQYDAVSSMPGRGMFSHRQAGLTVDFGLRANDQRSRERELSGSLSNSMPPCGITTVTEGCVMQAQTAPDLSTRSLPQGKSRPAGHNTITSSAAFCGTSGAFGPEGQWENLSPSPARVRTDMYEIGLPDL